jgi:hypothetical protein
MVGERLRHDESRTLGRKYFMPETTKHRYCRVEVVKSGLNMLDLVGLIKQQRTSQSIVETVFAASQPGVS